MLISRFYELCTRQICISSQANASCILPGFTREKIQNNFSTLFARNAKRNFSLRVRLRYWLKSSFLMLFRTEGLICFAYTWVRLFFVFPKEKTNWIKEQDCLFCEGSNFTLLHRINNNNTIKSTGIYNWPCYDSDFIFCPNSDWLQMGRIYLKQKFGTKDELTEQFRNFILTTLIDFL